jgi:serine/threonine protein kinase
MPKWNHLSIIKEVREFGTKRSVKLLVGQNNNTKAIKKEVYQGKKATKNLLNKLVREYYFLENLVDTGLTPYPKSLSLGMGGKSGILLMDYITGEAIVNHPEPPTIRQKLLFDLLIFCILKAIQTIHDRGIIMGDINQETFLMEGFWDDKTELKIRIIDLGFAARPSELNMPDTGDWLRLFYSINPQFSKLLQKKSFVLDVQTAKKMDLYRAMRVLMGYFLQEPWDSASGLSFELMGKQNIRENLKKTLQSKNIFAAEFVLDFLSAVFCQDIAKMPSNSYMLQDSQTNAIFSFTDISSDQMPATQASLKMLG